MLIYWHEYVEIITLIVQLGTKVLCINGSSSFTIKDLQYSYPFWWNYFESAFYASILNKEYRI